MDRVSPDVKSKIKKLITLLEDTGSQLSRIDKVPSRERQAWKIINNHIKKIKSIAHQIIDSEETTDKELAAQLNNVLLKDTIIYWSSLSDGLKAFL
jgi:hypothetical protein